jgi:hypothetical protein
MPDTACYEDCAANVSNGKSAVSVGGINITSSEPISCMEIVVTLRLDSQILLLFSSHYAVFFDPITHLF